MSGIDQVTSALVLKALDASALRHQAIASNIANANSTGYRPLRVNFEEQLGYARAALARGSSDLTLADIAGVRPRIEREAAPAAGSPSVMIDMEMVKLSQNTLHYQALVKGLTHRTGLLATAINEGRR